LPYPEILILKSPTGDFTGRKEKPSLMVTNTEKQKWLYTMNGNGENSFK
jgi:hypothetical protein